MTAPSPARRLAVRWAWALVLLLLAAACADAGTSGQPAGETPSETAAGTATAGGAAAATTAPDQPEVTEIVVGSTNFDEQEIVANMYALSLESEGFDVTRRFQLGSREVVLPALESGEIDTYPEYVGTALEFLNDGAGEATSDTEETTQLLRERFADRGIKVLQPADAQDKNGLVVTQETAEEFGLETVSDLAPVADELVFGGPPECPQRPLCLPGYTDTYGLEFADFRSLDAGGPVTATALSNGEIDVALLFTTDGAIAANDWVLLEDDMGLQPAENIVPVVREDVLNDAVAEALNAVSAVLTTDEVTELVRRVRIDLEDPAAVAEEFLAGKGVIES